MVRLADVCACVRRLHPDLQARVSQDTLKKYKDAIDPFLMYLQTHLDPLLEEVEDLDQMLLEFRTEFDLSRSKHTLLVAAVEFYMPHTKGKLLLSREALRGRTNADDIRHTVPLPKECAHLLAAHHASQGHLHLGAAVLVQQCSGLRPSELLGIRANHVFIPMHLVDEAKISIRLGGVVSTKVKREQCVLIHWQESPLVCKLLRWLVQSAVTEDAKLFSFGYGYYNQSFKLAEQHFGLQAGWTAHSGRAGFATDLIVRGLPVSVVQSRGRWLSETSFRCYVDVIGSLDTKARVDAKGLWAEALWCTEHAELYFSAVLSIHAKEAQLPRAHVIASRPQTERKPVPDSSTTLRVDPMGEAQVARRRTQQDPSSSSTQAAVSTSSSVGFNSSSFKGQCKGKGRGRLLSKTAKGSIFD